MGKHVTCTVSTTLKITIVDYTNYFHADNMLNVKENEPWFLFVSLLTWFLDIYCTSLMQIHIHTHIQTSLSDLMIISEHVVTTVCHSCDSKKSIVTRRCFNVVEEAERCVI